MKIINALSYLNSWDLLNEKPEILNEIKSSVASLTPEKIKKAKERYRNIPDSGDEVTVGKIIACWDDSMRDKGWSSTSSPYFYTGDGKRISVRKIGDIKDTVSVRLMFPRPDNLASWIFQDTALAFKHGIVQVPICLTFMRETFASLFSENHKSYFMRLSSSESLQAQLSALSPLSMSHPFLILGLSTEEFDDFHHEELDTALEAPMQHVIVDRCIEFPPEYQQAGIGILSYFSSILQEKYPDQDVGVKIIQMNNSVRMIIESSDGRNEIIEKEFADYSLVVSGNKSIEEYAISDRMIIELRAELRIASARIETQRDLLNLQDVRIDKLLNIMESSVTRISSPPVTVEISPIINVIQNSSQLSTVNFQNLIESLEDLADLTRNEVELAVLTEGLSSEAGTLLDEGLDKNKIAKSGILKRVSDFVGRANDTSSNLNQLLANVQGSMEIVKKVGRAYNSVAEWCGVPVIPSILVQ